MREIKFRAWDKERNKMIYSDDPWIEPDGMWDTCGVSWELTPNGMVCTPYWDKQKFDYYKNVELMQFTGLKDKNGKEIYEGDIVKGRWLSGTIAFSKSYAGWSVANGSMFERNFEDCEVIGNIYENPELVEEK